MRILVAILFATAVTFTCSSQSIISSGNHTSGSAREHDWTIGGGNARFGLEQYHSFSYVNRAPEKSWEKRYTIIHCGAVRFELPCQAGSLIAVLVAAFGSLIAAVLFSKQLRSWNSDQRRA
jgi:hypothetical protein